MKRKNGFTLIELLAVIVVLAIIALIATPIVMNTIKNSKKGASERTADNYVEQVETSLMTYRLENGENLPDGEYQITSDGNLCKDKTASCSEENKIKIEMNGTKPSSGTIVIENGQVKKESSSMKVGDYDVTYDSTKKTFVASESTGNDVEVLCKANTEKVSALVYSSGNPSDINSYNREEVGLLSSEAGKYTPGVTYTCNVGDGDRTFYVLEENGDNVSLILGTNLGSSVAWCTYEDYISAGGNIDEWEDGMGLSGNSAKGPVTVNNYLKEQTASWTKLKESQISLPTYDQIYKAAGNKNSELPSWLTTTTDKNVSFYYWTSTKYGYAGAYSVDFHGQISNNIVIEAASIRPVITISKSQLG